MIASKNNFTKGVYMTIVGQLPINDNNNAYFVQKNQQNSLKGLLWGTSGAVLTTGALALTAATVAGVGVAAMTALGVAVNDSARNSVGGFAVPGILALAAGASAVDYVAVKFTGFCYSNAIHHLGPQYEIVCHKKVI